MQRENFLLHKCSLGWNKLCFKSLLVLCLKLWIHTPNKPCSKEGFGCQRINKIMILITKWWKGWLFINFFEWYLLGWEGILFKETRVGILYTRTVKLMPEPEEVMDKRLGLEHPVWPVGEVTSPEQPVRWLQPSIIRHDWKANNNVTSLLVSVPPAFFSSWGSLFLPFCCHCCLFSLACF